ncbi:MAG TPA: amidohydrolase family protein [Bryobacteraceae bacterium]|nr:amidohydrolase family protein [Bryobacteraceae bacterium]
MNCSGIDVFTGRPLRIDYGETIRRVSYEETGGAIPFVSPGFIDIQVNGFDGVDFNDPSISMDEIARALDAMLATGVTRCLPTVITGAPDVMLACLGNLRRAQMQLPRRRVIAGFHVEGPHIGAEDGPRGAHPARWVRPPDLDEYRRWQDATGGNIRLITLSPHWPEAPRYIAAITRDGVVASIGHTGASADQIAAAVDAGATLSTHLGNGAHAVMRRHPNYIWDQLADDRLSASFIVDGIHLGRNFLRAALRAKGIERSILVTDAAGPAGAKPGRYRLGEQDVDLTPDDRVVLVGTEKLAGSALKMNRGVARLVRLAGLDLPAAVTMATVNPARLLGLPAPSFSAGSPADLVLFRNDGLDIDAVYLAGERIVGS